MKQTLLQMYETYWQSLTNVLYVTYDEAILNVFLKCVVWQ